MPPRNAKARKLYLSDEAIALLQAESERSTYPMSVIVDMLIKKAFGPPAPRKPAAAPLNLEPGGLNPGIKHYTPTQKKDFQFNG